MENVPITSQDLKTLYDLPYVVEVEDEDEYIAQNEIRNLLVQCGFDPIKFRKSLTAFIRRYRGSKYSTDPLEEFKKALYTPFKNLPKMIEGTSFSFCSTVVKWRLSTGV